MLRELTGRSLEQRNRRESRGIVHRRCRERSIKRHLSGRLSFSSDREESNRAVALYITGVPLPPPGRDKICPSVSFVPGVRRTREASPGRPGAARGKERKGKAAEKIVRNPSDRSLISRIESRAPRDDWKRWIRRNVLTEPRVPLFLAVRSTFFPFSFFFFFLSSFPP